jgi:hypothetical protein
MTRRRHDQTVVQVLLARHYASRTFVVRTVLPVPSIVATYRRASQYISCPGRERDSRFYRGSPHAVVTGPNRHRVATTRHADLCSALIHVVNFRHADNDCTIPCRDGLVTLITVALRFEPRHETPRAGEGCRSSRVSSALLSFLQYVSIAVRASCALRTRRGTDSALAMAGEAR